MALANKTRQELLMDQKACENTRAPTPTPSNGASPKTPNISANNSDYTSKPTLRQGRDLNRSEAASVLGISKSEFIRREDLGIYVATTIDHHGWHLFSMEYLSSLPGYGKEKRSLEGQTSQVRATRLKEAYVARGGSSYSPESAAKIFQALDDGMSSREIIKTLLVHPDTMDVVYDAWVRMATKEGGGIIVSAQQMAIINELPLSGSWPALTGEQFVKNLQKISKGTTMCPMCNARACQICVVCAQPEPEPSAPTPAKKTVGRPKQ